METKTCKFTKKGEKCDMKKYAAYWNDGCVCGEEEVDSFDEAMEIIAKMKEDSDTEHDILAVEKYYESTGDYVIIREPFKEDKEIEINVKDYGSNILFWVNGNIVMRDADGCRDFPYDINMEDIMEEVTGDLGRELTEEEKKRLKEKISTWVENHSCSDYAYYDYNDENSYWWIDTDYHHGDFNDKKFALIHGDRDENGAKDRETEEVVLWASYKDLGIKDDDTDAWDIIDCEILGKLGYVPDYEIN